ncbi:MAG: hypothetical protein HGA44_08185 [Cellulomonadaceae bacterium]|nr:hypothetical protein [Cellulomonadaceae bacterium]
MARDGSETRLLRGFPATAYERLIVRYPYQSDGDYAHAYQSSAQRLASTYAGRAEDDLILIPYLMLYRHAFELQMKSMIRRLVDWREVYGHGLDDGLRGATLEAHLKDNLGHGLYPIFNDLRNRYYAIAGVERIPPSIEKIISMLHEADRHGVSFRYAGGLPDRQENVDFPDLCAVLDQEFDWLSVWLDPLGAGFDAMPHPSELM